jgi:hypothetical protein
MMWNMYCIKKRGFVMGACAFPCDVPGPYPVGGDPVRIAVKPAA